MVDRLGTEGVDFERTTESKPICDLGRSTTDSRCPLPLSLALKWSEHKQPLMALVQKVLEGYTDRREHAKQKALSKSGNEVVA